MSITSRKSILKGITINDSHSRLRDNLLRKWFPNSIDGIRFYLFMGKLTQIPLMGRPLKKALSLYYRYLHTNSIILPLEDIEEIINDASHIAVDPCPCRLAAENDSCTAPLFVCMRINRSAQIRLEQKQSDGLSREEAVAIMRNARKHNMVFSLESCIQPYQNNICTCCSCCCIAMKMRYDFGIDVYHSGPYVPEFDSHTCTACNICLDKCPANALSDIGPTPVVDLGRCLGCGICAENCPAQCISMVKKPERIRQDTEPGYVRLLLSVGYIYLFMVPAFITFRLFMGSKKDVARYAIPRESDYRQN
jgi:formate hydrogenlyase subunit 6/NADH:ubiquinone oxidoreductase subunit I